MRVLLAIVVYQSLPLGPPFSHFPVAPDVVGAYDRVLRPPLPPLRALAPASARALTFSDQPHPNGLAQWIDLGALSDPTVTYALGWVAAACVLLYAAGRALPVAVPILALLSVAFGTLANSQGAIDHRHQLVSMMLIAQTGVVVWPFLVRIAARAGIADGPARPDRRNAALHYSAMAVLIAAYSTAGVAKIETSEGAWLARSHLLGIQAVKTYRQNFYDRLDEPRFGAAEVPYASAMLAHPDGTRIALAGGLFLELFAFLALYDRRSALGFGIAFITFHLAIDEVLGLGFHNHEKLVWILLVNVPYWAATGIRAFGPLRGRIGERAASRRDPFPFSRG